VLEQLVHLIRRRREMGCLKLVDRAIEQFHDLDQAEDAGISPRQLRFESDDLRGEDLSGGIIHASLLGTRQCVGTDARTRRP
jgi:hypothetical protein